MNSINNIPAEIICEIFDKDPKSGLILANTNKWFSEVLKDKIKKHRQLIRECNSAAVCYYQCFDLIFRKLYVEEDINFRHCFNFECYFYCVNCFVSFIPNFSVPFIFSINDFEEVHENGIMLCSKCAIKYMTEKLEY